MIQIAAALLLIAPPPSDFEEVVTATGIASYTIGACERFLTDEQLDRSLAAMFLTSEPPTAAGSMIAGLNARMYLQGRQDPERKNLTPSACLRLMEQAQGDLQAATAGVRPSQ